MLGALDTMLLKPQEDYFPPSKRKIAHLEILAIIVSRSAIPTVAMKQVLRILDFYVQDRFLSPVVQNETAQPYTPEYQ